MIKEIIVIASNNQGKKKELTAMLGDKYLVKTMAEVGVDHDTIEDQDTLKGNSGKKARELKAILGEGYSVLADDSGLFIRALNGAPGVKTARYAADHDDEANMNKVLSELESSDDRYAEFITVLCYIDNSGNEIYFGGALPLNISLNKRGKNGFGYDPILELNGKTLAEMTSEEKNKISHRGKALCRFKCYKTGE